MLACVGFGLVVLCWVRLDSVRSGWVCFGWVRLVWVRLG